MNMFSPKAGACLALLGGLGFAAGSQAAGTIAIGDGLTVSIGGGLRAGYGSTEDATSSGDNSNNFSLQSARLYLSGAAAESVKFTFNTECKGCVFGSNDAAGSGGDIDVLDAIAQFELSPGFNVWVGRMLTPADRIEMNGPYYGLSWNQYTVPLLPSDQTGQAGLLGRDDGVTVWGATGKFQYAVGLFDGVDGGPNSKDNPLLSARLAYNFLTMESNPGYYTSSTYFGGAGDIFTVGLVYQQQSDGVGTAALPSDFSAEIVDVLWENALSGGGAFTVEAEYKILDAEVAPLAVDRPHVLLHVRRRRVLRDGGVSLRRRQHRALAALRPLHVERAGQPDYARQRPQRVRTQHDHQGPQRANERELDDRRRESHGCARNGRDSFSFGVQIQI